MYQPAAAHLASLVANVDEHIRTGGLRLSGLKYVAPVSHRYLAMRASIILHSPDRYEAPLRAAAAQKHKRQRQRRRAQARAAAQGRQQRPHQGQRAPVASRSCKPLQTVRPRSSSSRASIRRQRRQCVQRRIKQGRQARARKSWLLDVVRRVRASTAHGCSELRLPLLRPLQGAIALVVDLTGLQPQSKDLDVLLRIAAGLSVMRHSALGDVGPAGPGETLAAIKRGSGPPTAGAVRHLIWALQGCSSKDWSVYVWSAHVQQQPRGAATHACEAVAKGADQFGDVQDFDCTLHVSTLLNSHNSQVKKWISLELRMGGIEANPGPGQLGPQGDGTEAAPGTSYASMSRQEPALGVGPSLHIGDTAHSIHQEGAEVTPADTQAPDPVAAPAQMKLLPQVFISHTGQDAQAKDFAVFIFKDLQSASVEVFMDYESLKVGCNWPQELVTAASTSMVTVVVLSKAYAKRFWCMYELDLALHGSNTRGGSKPHIIPVFYDPAYTAEELADIRKYWTDFTDPPNTLQDHKRQHLVHAQRWVDNIIRMKEDIQFLKLDSRSPCKDETWRLAKEVVKLVQQKIFFDKDVGYDVFGFEEQEETLVAKLREGRPALLWLHNIGGAGKTTLAKRMNCRLSPGFKNDAQAFIEIQMEDDPDKINGYVEVAIRSLGGTVPTGHSELATCLSRIISRKPCLLIIDNVCTASQLEKLLPAESWAPGTVVIVTSRFQTFPDCQKLHKVRDYLYRHEVGLLDQASSKQLLLNALHRTSAPDGLEGLQARILSACGGLPLAITLVAGNLAADHERTQKWQQPKWEAALDALKTGIAASDSDGRLHGIVAHSLNQLARPDQTSIRHLFMDVAILLHQQLAAHVEAMWVGLDGVKARSYLQELETRNLLKEDSSGRLVVHDVIVSLARGMILSDNPPHTHSRLWTNEEGRLQLYPHVDTCILKPRGVSLYTYHNENPIVLQRGAAPFGCSSCTWPYCTLMMESKVNDAEVFLDISECKILKLGYQQPPLPSCRAARMLKLNWLESHGGGCGSRLSEWIKNSPHLMVVKAPHAGESTLPHLSKLTQLRVLDLSGSNLERLPDNIGDMKVLTFLGLRHCSLLADLPDSLCRLSHLELLDIVYNGSIRKLPADIGRLTAMKKLLMGRSGAANNGSLPESFGKLQNLQVWDASFAPFKTLPDNISGLTSLVRLYLSGCTQLQLLPDSMGVLAKLENLDCSACFKLSELPGTVSGLTSLQQLQMILCGNLQKLPDSFGGMSSLTYISFDGCTQLQEIPPSFSALRRLCKLDLTECSSLARLPECFGELSALKHLELTLCTALQFLPPSFSQLQALQVLHVSNSVPQQPYIAITQMTRLEMVDHGFITKWFGAGRQLKDRYTACVVAQADAPQRIVAWKIATNSSFEDGNVFTAVACLQGQQTDGTWLEPIGDMSRHAAGEVTEIPTIPNKDGFETIELRSGQALDRFMTCGGDGGGLATCEGPGPQFRVVGYEGARDVEVDGWIRYVRFKFAPFEDDHMDSHQGNKCPPPSNLGPSKQAVKATEQEAAAAAATAGKADAADAADVEAAKLAASQNAATDDSMQPEHRLAAAAPELQNTNLKPAAHQHDEGSTSGGHRSARSKPNAVANPQFNDSACKDDEPGWPSNWPHKATQLRHDDDMDG